MGNIDYSEVIRSVSYSQHEILYNIMKLHNGGKPFECDMTYSIGKFYGKFSVEMANGNKTGIEIPQPRLKFDVCPQMEDVVMIDPNGRLPLEDSSIESIVVDLPFVISPRTAPSILNDDGGKKRNIIFKRFSSYYPVGELLESYEHWIKECYRVLKPNGICVWKTQSTISARKNLMTPYFSWMIAEETGFTTHDEFILCAHNRLHSGKIRRQEHARKFHSHFFVFKKDSKLKLDYTQRLTQ